MSNRLKQELARQRYSIPQLALLIPCPTHHLGNVVNGRVAPAPIVRQRLPEILEVPLDELLTPEQIAKEYGKGGSIRGRAWAEIDS